MTVWEKSILDEKYYEAQFEYDYYCRRMEECSDQLTRNFFRSTSARYWLIVELYGMLRIDLPDCESDCEEEY